MKPSAVLKKLFTVACVYYAIFSLALLLINVILVGSTDGMVIGVLNVLLLFPFALSLSGAEFLRKSEKLSGVARILLHDLIFAAALLLFLWLSDLLLLLIRLRLRRDPSLALRMTKETIRMTKETLRMTIKREVSDVSRVS